MAERKKDREEKEDRKKRKNAMSWEIEKKTEKKASADPEEDQKKTDEDREPDKKEQTAEEEEKNEVIEEISSERKSIERSTFLSHLFHKIRKQEVRPLQEGLGSLKEEYEEFTEKKETAVRKYMTYEAVIANATDTPEYYILLILSCLITAFGLYADSPAVIIGAMIVAPLMGPILGFSAGVLWGSGEVIGKTLFTMLKGVLIVLGITFLITFAIPYINITDEMLARTRPGFADILIALASGLIGAYAYANNKVSSAIPGVAIAVALMPPLCTIGIGLGLFNFDLARRAALLFAINLVCISLAALIVFYLIRLNPEDEESREYDEFKKRFFRQTVISVILLIIICIPLVFFTIPAVRINRDKEIINTAVMEHIPEESIYSMDIRTHPDPESYSVRVILLELQPDSYSGARDQILDDIQKGMKKKRSVELSLFFLGNEETAQLIKKETQQ